jgi:hypothetical protein
MRTLILAALIGLALTSIPPGIAQEKFTAGTWAGEGYQVNPAGPASSWTIRLQILKNGDGVIDYPSLNCGGKLIKQPAAGFGEYREHLDYGSDKCVDHGRVVILEKAGELSWYWSGDGTNNPKTSASAVLSRVSDQQTTTERKAAPRSAASANEGTINVLLKTGNIIKIRDFTHDRDIFVNPHVIDYVDGRPKTSYFLACLPTKNLSLFSFL